MFHNKDGAALDLAIVRALESAEFADPFAVLGPHTGPRGAIVRAYLPGAFYVEVRAREDGEFLGALDDRQAPGLFAGSLASSQPYVLAIRWTSGIEETEDPYAFGPLLGDLDLHLIQEGRHRDLASALGATPMAVDGIAGVRFAVWAPHARRVAVVGDFNAWDDRRHPMRLRHGAGVWELFLPRVAPGARYKFAMRGADGAALPLRADPCARSAERPPLTASRVAAPLAHAWDDADWMSARAARQDARAPLSICEVHLDSWLRKGQSSSWDTAIERLAPYLLMSGFTHVAFTPLAEHPADESWGYEPACPFAPTGRYGEPSGFARLVEACHKAGVGVIVDMVVARFSAQAEGLAQFDGGDLYERAPTLGEAPGACAFDLGRREVRGFPHRRGALLA